MLLPLSFGRMQPLPRSDFEVALALVIVAAAVRDGAGHSSCARASAAPTDHCVAVASLWLLFPTCSGIPRQVGVCGPTEARRCPHDCRRRAPRRRQQPCGCALSALAAFTPHTLPPLLGMRWQGPCSAGGSGGSTACGCGRCWRARCCDAALHGACWRMACDLLRQSWPSFPHRSPPLLACMAMLMLSGRFGREYSLRLREMLARALLRREVALHGACWRMACDLPRQSWPSVPHRSSPL